MSYIEHGPRIFCAGRSGNPLPLNYGDCVLAKKRSEGRLKMFDSCSDIRAWSPNPVENSRYIRELAENAPKPGKVPFNVLIEDLIKMGSQTQEELELVKKELEKYKSLKLTSEQKDELKKIAKSLDEERQSHETNLKGRSLSKIILDTFLSGSYENQREDVRFRGLGNTSVTLIENKDVSVQVQPRVSELAVQYDSPLNIENISKISTVSTSTSNSTLRDETSFCSVNSGFENSDLSESESEISKSAYDSDINRSVIIEKESKIIALENEVQAKNAELDEREEKIKGMRKSVRSMKDVLDIKCQEMEDLTTKLHVFKFEKRKLQDSLDNQSRVSEVQLDEINRLRFIIDQEGDIKNNLSKQLEQMRRERDAFRRKTEMLQQEVKEKTEILAANEKELGGLFLSWKRTTEDHDKSKAKTMEVLKVLESEIEEKNSRICEYETQILNVEQEVGDMFIMLKTSLSEIEFIDKYDCECNNNLNENQNIVSQTKATISNLSLCVKQIENERKSLLKQLDELRNEKNCIKYDCGVADVQTYVNYESSTDYEETPKNSEVEMKHFNFYENENEDRTFKEMSSNCTNSQDCLELQVAEQESTIEMWNCSFDKKIDSAFESHVATSILKIVKLTEGLKDVETGKMMEIEELKSEIMKRDLEITKLRSQIEEQSSQWKGEGDCYERERVDRNKRELELEEELQTYQHKLLGANEDNVTLTFKVRDLQNDKKLLYEKYEKVHRELQLRNRDWLINEKYKNKFEEMQLRLPALQLENENLMQELLEMNKEIEMQREKVLELSDKKEEVEKLLYKSRENIQSRNSEIEYLKEENKNLDKRLQKTLKNNAKLEEFKSMNNRTVSELSQLQKEVKKSSEEKCKLEEKNFALQSSLMEYQKGNVELESELEEINMENEDLRRCIKTMEHQIKVIVDNEIELKKTDISNVFETIATLKEKLDNPKFEKEEKGEKFDRVHVTRSTTMNEEFELNFLKDLSTEKEKIHLANESRQKEDEIERLKHELDEKNLEIKNMEEKHKQSLIMVTKKKDEEFKKLRSLHDQNVQNLKTSFNSFNSEGFSFGTEDWLKSLSTDEILDLCERISVMIPSKEFSKSMNIKQKRLTELEYKIAEVTQNSTFKVEELESIIQKEKNKSAKLEKRLSSLSQNQEIFQIYPKKNRNKSFKTINFYDDSGPNFPYYIANQECVNSTRFQYNQTEKRSISERKSYSGDESLDSRRRDFIHQCSTSMRPKYYPSC